MDQKLRRRSILALALLTTIALMLSGSNCQTPTQRPGNSFDGSAHWARDIAQTLIDNFAADVQIYHINGVQVYEDGRLPANAGSWGLVA